MAAATCGSKLTPINPQFKANELSKMLNQSHSSVLIAHWSCIDVALEAVKDSPLVKHVITIPEDDGMAVPEGTISLSSLKEHSNPLYDTNAKVKRDPSSHSVLLPYSSGTTGLPKVSMGALLILCVDSFHALIIEYHYPPIILFSGCMFITYESSIKFAAT